MPFCPKCQCNVYGYLCTRCGSVPATQSPIEVADERDRATAYCYALGPLSAAYFLISPKHSENVTIRFHAWQSILCSIAMVVLLGLYYWLASTIDSRIGTVKFDDIGKEFPRFLLGAAVGVVSVMIVPAAAISLWLILLTAANRDGTCQVPILGKLAAKWAKK